MKCTMYLLRLAFILFYFALPALAEFRVGAAKQKITPDPLLPVSGGMGPANPA